MAKLTNKQEAFCIEYMKDCNGTQAAIRAGYSENGADVQGTRLLANASVSAKVKELQNINKAQAICSFDDRMKLLWDSACINAATIENDEGVLKQVNPTAMISAIDQINKMTGDHAAIKQRLEADIEGSLNVPTSINLIAKK